MNQDYLAALDLGSNTFRLLLAAEADGSLSSRQVWQEIPRLSENIAAGADLAEAPKKRAWEALERFADILKVYKPKKTLAGGTMVFREAADGQAFLAEIAERFGWRTVLLSGFQEAYLSAQGVLSGLASIPDKALIFDVGGRSTELVRTEGRRIKSLVSLNAGVVGLTEEFVKHDPPRPGELSAIERRLESLLASARLPKLSREAVLVGTAGTVTTIAAMLLDMARYDGDRVNNQVISVSSAENLLREMAGMNLDARKTRAGLDPRRADVIVAGLVLVKVLARFFRRSEAVVSDKSLLEGLWLAAAGHVPLSPPSF